MWSFERYFKRIFLPLLFVALVAVGLRIYMTKEFNERNVRMEPVESEVRDDGRPVYTEALARQVEFSEENRSLVVASLQRAQQRLEASLAERENVSKAERETVLADKKEAVAESIDALGEATEDNWSERREAAYQSLEAYADAISEASDADGSATASVADA